MQQKIKIIFFGSSPYSLSVLEALCRKPRYRTVGIVSQPDRPLGRKKILTPTPVSQFAKEHQIKLFRPKRLNDETINSQLSTANYQLIIVADYALKLPKKLLNFPQYGALNLHPSLLPAYRGSSPAQWAILRREKKSGISIIKMSPKFDQGPILAQKEISIFPTDSQKTLYERCYKEGAKILIEMLPHWIEYCEMKDHKNFSFLTFDPSTSLTPRQTRGDLKPRRKVKVTLSLPKGDFAFWLPPKPQSTFSPTPYARRLTKEDGRIDWNKSDVEIERKVQAFHPWPGTWTTIAELYSAQIKNARPPHFARAKAGATKLKIKNSKGKKRVKVLKAHLNENGKLQIDQLQIEGKKPLSWGEFKRGYLE